MNMSINQLYQHHEGKISDKWSSYLDVWDMVFAPIQKKTHRLLEIGVQNGGSLEIWGKYFYWAEKIVGCDIDPKCSLLEFKDARIKVVIGDVNSETCKRQIFQHASEFELIIDDGSHKSSDIIRSFANYFSALSDEGVYLIEDLHCSYWDDYEGGLNNPLSAIAFFKRLADIINYEHWRKNISRSHLLARFTEKYSLVLSESDLSKIHSIEFVNSICIIKKAPVENNLLGKRIVVGKEEIVTSEAKAMDETLLQNYSPSVSNDEDNDFFALIEKNEQLQKAILMNDENMQSLSERLNKTIQLKDQEIRLTNEQLSENKNHIRSLTSRIARYDQGIRNLAKRLQDANQKIDFLVSQSSSSEKKIEELSVQLANTEYELLSVVLSQSWRITRPLRKIRSLIGRQ